MDRTTGPETAGHTIGWAKLYDSTVAILTLGRARAIRRRTAELAQFTAGETVLDVGCGTGDLTLLARKALGANGRVVGVDASPEMIEEARRKAQRTRLSVEYQVAAIEALPFPDASFDVVLSSLMMHHLPHDLRRHGLAELRRVLKPGGRLLVVDLKRPVGRRAHLSPLMLAHSGLSMGVQDYAPLLEAEGFAGIESGNAGHRAIGFVRGRLL